MNASRASCTSYCLSSGHRALRRRADFVILEDGTSLCVDPAIRSQVDGERAERGSRRSNRASKGRLDSSKGETLGRSILEKGRVPVRRFAGLRCDVVESQCCVRW